MVQEVLPHCAPPPLPPLSGVTTKKQTNKKGVGDGEKQILRSSITNTGVYIKFENFQPFFVQFCKLEVNWGKNMNTFTN